jgi:tetratricopeptide (TPR) repeat protein
VILTVKKKGFQTSHSYVNFGHAAASFWIPITMHEVQEEDPEQLSQADLISGLAPKLRQLGPQDGLAAKSAKDYTRGVAAFLDQHDFVRAVPLLEKVQADNPTCIACRTMLGLADLNWSAWDNARDAFAKGVNATLKDRSNGRPEPLVAYGTWLNWENDAEGAEPYLQEAIKLSAQDPLALQEFGRSLMVTQQFDAARDYLKKAIAAGAGPEGQLLYIKSCLGSGHTDEAATEMTRYLAGRDVKKMPLRVREVWGSLKDREKLDATYGKSKPQRGHAQLDFLQSPPADLIKGLEPAKDQEQLPSILDATGKKILEMTQNFPNTISEEAIHQEKLSNKGKLRGSQDQTFRYLCMLPTRAWGPAFKEFRADSLGGETQPKGMNDGFMLTKGFTSAALMFHPTYRSESTFRYLGRQKINGQDTLVVAFSQIPGKAHLVGNFQSGQTSLTTFTQGLAWIDPSTFRIIRLHTELLRPLPELRLEKEALNIDFNEVHFKKSTQALWLPGQVTVTINWDGKTLRNTHAYSDFKIFNVNSSEKIGAPKAAAASPNGAHEPAATP